MKKITILETIRQGKIGGGESHVLSLISKIDQHKFRPVVLSFSEGEMVDILKEMGITTYVISTEKPFNLFLTNQVIDILKKEQVDIVHAHGTRAASNSFHAAKKLNIPLIYTVHAWSFHPSLSPLIHKITVLLESFLTKKAKKTICVSHVNQKEGQDLFQLANSKVIVNGVNTDKFNYQKEFSSIREELNIPKHLFVLSYIVRMTYQKDPMTLLNAIKRVKSQNENIGFILVGDGELRQEMENFIKKNKLEDVIFFEQFRKDIPRILSGTDAYILPSLWEGLPIGLLEAMAMEKKIIVSDAEANQELIKNKMNGMVFPRQNAESLANAILYMQKNPVEANKMAVKARKLIYEQYGLNQMVHKVEETYQEVFN